MGRPGLRGSEITLYGESGCPPTATRPKVKTNGHFTTFMQSRQDLTSSGSEWPSPTRLPKTRPSNPKTGSGPQQLLQQQQDAMSQSCPTPTPPQGRRRFFLSPKALRSPFSQRASGRQQRAHEAMSGKIASKYMVYIRLDDRHDAGKLCIDEMQDPCFIQSILNRGCPLYYSECNRCGYRYTTYCYERVRLFRGWRTWLAQRRTRKNSISMVRIGLNNWGRPQPIGRHGSLYNILFCLFYSRALA